MTTQQRYSDSSNNQLCHLPAYVALARYTHRCPTYLLVVCTKTTVAERYAKQIIKLGHPGFNLRLLVLGPEGYPIVNTHTEARAEPELAVLSGIAHGDLDDARDAAFYAIDLIAIHDQNLAALYHDVVMAALPKRIRKIVEDQMTAGTWEYQSDYHKKAFAEGEAQGEARGEAKGIVNLLEYRGVELTDATIKRIESCTDLQQLEKWSVLARTVTSADQLFA